MKKVYKPARGTEHEESNYCIHYLCSYWGIGLLLQERKELGKMIFTRGCKTESTIYKATSKESSKKRKKDKKGERSRQR